MKLSTTFLLIFFLTLSYNQLHSQAYTLDKDKSGQISWTGYGEVGGYAQTGTLNVEAASLDWDVEQKLSGEITIDMKSLYHEDKELMKHLKNKDFFDVKKYPTAIFRFAQNKDKKVAGELTIKGVTGTLAFSPEITIKDERVIVKGKVEVDRTYYGIKYNSSSYFQDLGSYAIKNIFDISFELEYVLDE
ncbi:MAG: YceI family protein [Bacteroidota bacterium]